VLLGAYTREEMLEEGDFAEKAVKPPNGGEPPDGGLSERLSAAALRSAGFSPTFASRTIDQRAVADDNTASAPTSGFAPVDEERGDGESGAPPSPPAPTDGQQQASEDPAATSGAESAESRPRATQRRPRPAKPEGDDAAARLV
jgi:hypothetical protein